MTAIEIINLALSDCGASPINSFDDDTAEARQAKAKYTGIRDAVLETREWTVAKRRLVLAKDPVAPAFGYSAQFILPSETLRVVRVRDANMNKLDDWVREGWRVLCNESAVYAEILVRVDEGEFSPGMVLTLAARLTSALAIPLTENRQLAKDFMDMYDKLIIDAGAMDGSQGRSQQMKPPALPGRRQHL